MTMPPSHFLKVMVQRGTITVFMPAGAIEGVPIIGPPIPIPGIAVPGRSIIIAVAISNVLPDVIGRTDHGPAAVTPRAGATPRLAFCRRRADSSRGF